jgi:hypothetical protein
LRRAAPGVWDDDCCNKMDEMLARPEQLARFI